MALLTVMALVMVMTASSTSLIWMMNQQQTRAGARLRSTAALAVAEAGIQMALSILESVAPDGTPGRAWRPTGFTQTVSIGTSTGRFTLSLTEEPDGAIVVTSAGEVSGTTRRLRVRVYLSPPVVLAALAGRGVIALDSHPATILIAPYGAAPQQPSWIHIAAGSGIEFASKDVALNNGHVGFETAPGPMDPPERAVSPTLRSLGPVRILLARGAALTLGPGRRHVDIQYLQTVGIRVGETVPYAGRLTAPEVNRAYYQRLAAGNTNNAGLNEAAGKHAGDPELAGKRDSLYDWAEFERLTMYLWAERLPGSLRGVIYVKGGGVSLLDGQRVQIVDGALITESTVEIAEGASLEITHSAATRTLPGLISLDAGALVITQGARLRAHGLVFAGKTIDAGKNAHVDIVGAVVGNDPGFSFRTFGASVVIRYDAAVLGTPGLRPPTNVPVIAWGAAWEELP